MDYDVRSGLTGGWGWNVADCYIIPCTSLYTSVYLAMPLYTPIYPDRLSPTSWCSGYDPGLTLMRGAWALGGSGLKYTNRAMIR